MIFCTGALRSGGAAVNFRVRCSFSALNCDSQLYEPYTDNPTTRGIMRIDPEVLNEVIPRFLKDGWQVVCFCSVLTRAMLIHSCHDLRYDPYHGFPRLKNVHAIGDRANGLVLDAFEKALKDSDVKALRPRLEHAQLLAEKDMARFGDLGGKLVLVG